MLTLFSEIKGFCHLLCLCAYEAIEHVLNPIFFADNENSASRKFHITSSQNAIEQNAKNRQ